MRSNSAETTPPFDIPELILWIARVLTYALVIVVPWPYGMVEWRSQVWLVPIACVILLLTLGAAYSRKMSHPHLLVWPLIVLLIVAVLQTVSLPEPIWRALSQTANFEERVNSLAAEFSIANEDLVDDASKSASALGSSISPPQTISIHPLQTRTTACVIASAVALLLSASILFRDRPSLLGLYLSLALSGFAISALGLYQSISANDWTLLPKLLPTSFATFIGRNSAPQFLVCGLAGATGLLMLYSSIRRKSAKDSRYQIKYPSVNLFAKLRRRIDDFVSDVDVTSALCLVVMITISVAILVDNSRGGTISCFLGAAIAFMAFLLGRTSSTGAMIGLFVLVIASAAFLSFYELDEIIGQRLDTVSEEAYRLDNERFALWSMILSQPGCWKLGSGLGTFHFSILPFYSTPQAAWFYHAESIYFELLSNQGIFVLLIMLGGILALLRQLLLAPRKSKQAKVVRFVCLFAVAAILLQSIVDFSLILPAVFVPLATLVGAFWGANSVPESPRGRTSKRSEDREDRQHRSRPSRLKPEDWKARSGGSAAAGFGRQRISVGRSEPNTTFEEQEIVRDRSSERMFSMIQSGIVLMVMAYGFGPLCSFASSERLAAVQISDLGVDNSWQMQVRTPEFPETRFQIGRLRQSFAEKTLLISPRWPENLTEPMRELLSKPEFFTAAFRASQDPEMRELRALVETAPEVISSMNASASDMLAAINGCPLDWRSNWGLLRSEMGELSRDELDHLYGRVLTTCRNNPAVLQAAGTHALLVGHSTAGLRIWREILPSGSQARTALVNLVGRLITVEQLMEVIPSDPWPRLEMADRLYKVKKQDEALLVLKSIDLAPLMSREENRAYNWNQLAWAAAQLGDIGQELEALRRAVLDAPTNISKAVLYVDALERAGQISDAVDEMDRVVKLSGNNPTFVERLDRLKLQLDKPN